MTTPASRLRGLADARFVPPADDAPWSHAAEAAAFAAAVEDFAASYWSLSPAARRERYNQLWKRRTGAAAARLGELEAGLSVTPDMATDPWVADVCRRARELFVLPPRIRAARRTAALGPGFRPGDYAAAARQWLRLLPEFTLLEPQLFDRFVGGWGPIPVPHRERTASHESSPSAADAERDDGNAVESFVIACLWLTLTALALEGFRFVVR